MISDRYSECQMAMPPQLNLCRRFGTSSLLFLQVRKPCAPNSQHPPRTLARRIETASSALCSVILFVFTVTLKGQYLSAFAWTISPSLFRTNTTTRTDRCLSVCAQYVKSRFPVTNTTDVVSGWSSATWNAISSARLRALVAPDEGRPRIHCTFHDVVYRRLPTQLRAQVYIHSGPLQGF